MSNNQKRIFYSRKLEDTLITLSDYKPKLLFKYQLFVHNIIYQQTYKKLSYHDFVPINKNKMSFDLGNDPGIYYHIRSVLLDNNLINVFTKKNKEGKLVEPYSVGTKSKQYRLHKDYIDDISTKVITNDYIGKLKEKNQKLFNNNLEKDEDANRMYKQYKYLKIKEDEAIIFCDSISDILTDYQYKYHTYMIKSFNQLDDTFFTWINPGFRHYTQLTSLSRYYRKYLYFDRIQYEKDNNLEISNNHKLINIDIKNSQPLLFNILIQKYLENNSLQYQGIVINPEELNVNKLNEVINNIYDYDSFYNNLQPLLYDELIYVATTFLDILPEEKKKEFIIEEWSRYKKETEKGVFYDRLISENENRNEFKEIFFKYLFFGRYWKKYISDIELKFLKKYPLIYSIINSYKIKDYKQLSILLQKEESDLIIRKICKKINEKNPNILLATIHDSILCESIYKDIVIDTIKEEFEKINLFPALSIN